MKIYQTEYWQFGVLCNFATENVVIVVALKDMKMYLLVDAK